MNVAHLSVRNKEFDISEEGMLDTQDVNIASILGARKHYWLGERDIKKLEKYDMFFVTMSKIKEKYENEWLELICIIKDKWPDKKVIIYQEAEVDWPLRFGPNEQIGLYKAIKMADVFLCHNYIDTGFYKMFEPETKIFRCKSPLPIEKIQQYDTKKHHEFDIIFGSSFDNRACGLLGYSVAMSLHKKYDKYRFLQYFRSKWDDDRTNKIRDFFGLDFIELGHLSWENFCKRISCVLFGMNLMPAAAAGRDAIVFAALGVPHIGNCRLDAMKTCFPDLAIDPLDCNKAIDLASKLIEDGEFYDQVRLKALDSCSKFSFKSVKSDLKISLEISGIQI